MLPPPHTPHNSLPVHHHTTLAQPVASASSANQTHHGPSSSDQPIRANDTFRRHVTASADYDEHVKRDPHHFHDESKYDVSTPEQCYRQLQVICQEVLACARPHVPVQGDQLVTAVAIIIEKVYPVEVDEYTLHVQKPSLKKIIHHAHTGQDRAFVELMSDHGAAAISAMTKWPGPIQNFCPQWDTYRFKVPHGQLPTFSPPEIRLDDNLLSETHQDNNPASQIEQDKIFFLGLEHQQQQQAAQAQSVHVHGDPAVHSQQHQHSGPLASAHRRDHSASQHQQSHASAATHTHGTSAVQHQQIQTSASAFHSSDPAVQHQQFPVPLPCRTKQDHEVELAVQQLKDQKRVGGHILMYKVCEEFKIYRVWMYTGNRMLRVIEFQLDPDGSAQKASPHQREFLYRHVQSDSWTLQNPEYDADYESRRLERDLVLDLKYLERYLSRLGTYTRLLQKTETWPSHLENATSEAMKVHAREDNKHFKTHADLNPHSYHELLPNYGPFDVRRIIWVICQEVHMRVERHVHESGSNGAATFRIDAEVKAALLSMRLYPGKQGMNAHDVKRIIAKLGQTQRSETMRRDELKKSIKSTHGGRLTDEKHAWASEIQQCKPDWDAYEYHLPRGHLRMPTARTESRDDLAVTNFVALLNRRRSASLSLMMYKVCTDFNIYRVWLHDKDYSCQTIEFQNSEPPPMRIGPSDVGPGLSTVKAAAKTTRRGQLYAEDGGIANPAHDRQHAVLIGIRDVVLDMHHVDEILRDPTRLTQHTVYEDRFAEAMGHVLGKAHSIYAPYWRAADSAQPKPN